MKRAPLKYIEEDNRLSLSPFPISREVLKKAFLEAKKAFWTHEELRNRYDQDRIHWKSLLSTDDKIFAKHIFMIFSIFDKVINLNIDAMIGEIQIPEAQHFYTYQKMIEVEHQYTYDDMINIFVDDAKEKEQIQKSICNSKIKKIITYTQDIFDNYEEPFRFAARLFVNACIEGLVFADAFVFPYWLAERGLMPGIAFANDLIARDEASHTEFGALLYSFIEDKNKLPKAEMIQILMKFTQYTKDFMEDAIPNRLEEMNHKLLSVHLEYMADNLLALFGVTPIYKSQTPFEFMKKINMTNKTNFFERGVAEYQKSDPSIGDILDSVEYF